MKTILIFLMLLAAVGARGQGEPIQRSQWTTNLPGATLNGFVVTNDNWADGGGNIASGRSVIGSQAGMNPAGGQGWLLHVNGSATGYGLGGDNALIIQDDSTNFSDNSGVGSAVMGYGASGATVLGLTQGPTFSHIGTNKSETFINGGSEIVFNYDAVNDKFFTLCAPGGGLIGSDTGNYAGFFWDLEHHLFRIPLIPGGTTNGGCYQPDDIVYDFTVSGVGVAPPFPSGYTAANGKPFTTLSNNIAAGSGHLMMIGNLGAANAGPNTLTKFSSGTGDATISYSAVVANRTYIGDTFFADQQNGRVQVFSNLVDLKGAFISQQAIQAFGPVNANPFGATATNGNPSLIIGNSDGVSAASSRGQEMLYLGQGGHVLAVTSFVNWNSINSFDIGGDELGDDNTDGNASLYVHGSYAGNVTNTAAASYTLAGLDSSVVVKASGVSTLALPDAGFHAKGREYQLLNDGTTNFTVTTTSNVAVSTNLETIGLNTTQTNLTVVPGQAVPVQSDGSNWKFLYSPGVITTNFVSGQVYTNTYGRIIEVSANATLTTTGVSGNASLSLIANGYRTNIVGMSTIVTSIAMSYTNYIAMAIPPGQTYTLSNTSAGAGDSSAPNAGQILVY